MKLSLPQSTMIILMVRSFNFSRKFFNLLCTSFYLGRCTITDVESSDINPSATGQTAIVRMSDPTTFYPGNSIESVPVDRAPVDQWDPVKSQSDCEIDIEPASKSAKDVGFRSLLSRIKRSSSKQKNKWFKKKKAVALSA